VCRPRRSRRTAGLFSFSSISDSSPKRQQSVVYTTLWNRSNDSFSPPFRQGFWVVSCSNPLYYFFFFMWLRVNIFFFGAGKTISYTYTLRVFLSHVRSPGAFIPTSCKHTVHKVNELLTRGKQFETIVQYFSSDMLFRISSAPTYINGSNQVIESCIQTSSYATMKSCIIPRMWAICSNNYCSYH